MISKLLLAASIAASVGIGLAQAQDAPREESGGGAGIRSGNITGTGATVPNPGASQSAGTTSLDRGIQAEDTKIQGSICKGC